MIKTCKKITHLSLFSGIGGIDLAAEAAGFTTVCQCEFADYPLKILRKHWPKVPKFKNITDLTREGFIEKTKTKSVTLISGGFPCQPFSSAGKKKGFADTRYLWPEMARVVSELHPDWVLGENVAGFINMGLDKTIFDLEREGYRVQTFVYPACGVGAWHERARTFIVASDVSHSACFRQYKESCECAENENIGFGGRELEKNKQEQQKVERSAFGGGVLSYANGIGRLPLEAEMYVIQKGKSKSFVADNIANAEGEKVVGEQYGIEPQLGRVADGIPDGMDGHKQWRREPLGISRTTQEVRNRAERLKALGNAVCPQQVYPILRCIADIELGRCKKVCVFGKDEVR